MKKTIFEEMGGTYVRQGDYLIPRLTLPTEEKAKPIGVWGQRHKCYLKEHHRGVYTTLLTSGKLNSYLADIDEQAREMFFRLVEQMAAREGVTEQLKAADQMAWVGTMNNIRNRAMEVVNQSMIYTDSLFNSRQFHAEYEEPPKVFWKYYDLYRRKKISLSEYAANTGLSTVVLEYYLKNIVQMEPRVIENPKQI